MYLNYATAQVVDTTLTLHWDDNFLSGMTMPLTEFTESMKKTEKDWEDFGRTWIEKGVTAENLKELNITRIVPIRYELPTKRMVCCHPSCTTQGRGQTAIPRQRTQPSATTTARKLRQQVTRAIPRYSTATHSGDGSSGVAGTATKISASIPGKNT